MRPLGFTLDTGLGHGAGLGDKSGHGAGTGWVYGTSMVDQNQRIRPSGLNLERVPACIYQCHYVRASVLQRLGTYECVHLCVYVSVSICSYSAMMRYVSLVSLFSVPSDALSGAPSEPPTVTITIALASAVSKLFKILQARGSASVEFRLSSTQPQPGLYLSFANDQMMLA